MSDQITPEMYAPMEAHNEIVGEFRKALADALNGPPTVTFELPEQARTRLAELEAKVRLDAKDAEIAALRSLLAERQARVEELQRSESQLIDQRDEFEEAFDDLVTALGVETEYSSCRFVGHILADALEAVEEMKGGAK
jgi:predicted transcriptional regulator